MSTDLQRRELLRRAAWILGGTISAPAALAILQGCSAKESATGAPAALKVLNASQFAMLSEIAEIMIPRTDTSGARDAAILVSFPTNTCLCSGTYTFTSSRST